MATLNCPSCGGAIEGVSPFIRSIDCSYCGAWIRLSNQVWQAEDGQKAPLDAPSYLRVGLRGDAPDGTQFNVRGRIRFQYGMGIWDEWWVENNQGDGFWVEEDDGVYYRHAPGDEITLSGSESVGVGQMLSLPNGPSLFITEKFDAVIIGREGMLPNEPVASETITYMDGVADGDEYSLEIDGNSAYVSQSEVFNLRDIKWDQA